ncbi:Copper amine oxidase N-terminal domain-containing protein [Paenibacillus sp. ov031]|nr:MULTISPECIES: stalk domain-containing protein [unclassified Paenibacillus]SDK44484.1 Copper amine oxidase N-terminal domain-containing protein [Paenibacillus sp. OK060]SHN59691.1 Copper amine oxidase N-terminal domain-containing protein [Paenibacillus sp. ov031]
MKNRFISGIVSIALFLIPITAHANNNVTFDGKMLDNRVYLPTRKTGEQLGAKICWNQKTKTASIQQYGDQLVDKVGPYVKILDGREFMFNFVN